MPILSATLLSLLACSSPRTLILVVQGQPAPPGARLLQGPGAPVDAWRSFVSGVSSEGESWPMVLPARMDADLRIQAPMRGKSSFSHPPFWDGHSSAAVLFVPTTWPIQEAGIGVKVLAPVPDLRGTPGTPTWFGPKFASQLGVAHVGLFKEGDRYLGRLSGPQVPGTGTPKRDLNFEVDRDKRAAVFQLGAQQVQVAQEAPAVWIPVDFALGDHHSAHAWARFHSVKAFNELQLLMSPLHLDATQPWTQMSWPAAWSAELAQTHGPFATAIAPYPVAAVAESGLSCAAMKAELLTLSEERSKVAAAQKEQLVVLGSVAPQAWSDSGCQGDAGLQAMLGAKRVLKEAAGSRDRVVLVGVSPHWVLGVEAGSLSELGAQFLD